jgi:quercetin dioxygenase-like cupin family protein
MALAPGGELPIHRTDGPVTIHVLEGEVLFLALGREYPLRVGDVLVFAAGVEHSARSQTGVRFLLTIVHVDSEATSAELP